MDKPAQSIMSSNLVTLSPSHKLVDAKAIFQSKNFHHHIPVVENGDLVGMVSLSDFLYASEGAGIDDTAPAYSKSISEIMAIHPFTLAHTASIRDVANALAKNEVHAIVLVDGKRPVGIISTTDILRYLLK